VGDEEVISDVKPIGDAVDQDTATTERGSQSQAMVATAPITLTLGVGEDDSIIKTNVRINDSELQGLLQIFFAHYPSFGPDLALMAIDSPFEPFIHHWRDLQALAKCHEGHAAVSEFRNRIQRFKESTRDMKWPKRLEEFASSSEGIERTSQNLTLLLDLVHECVRGRAGEQSLSRLLEENSPASQEVVNFETLWTIYKPGDIVISRAFLDEPQAFIVHESLESGMVRKGILSHWSLDCWSYDWSGKTFERVLVELRIDLFKGSRKVQSLPVYPIKYLSEAERDQIELRGRRFREISLSTKGSRLFQYSGDAILRASGIGKVELVSYPASQNYRPQG